jgi:hypothetical protein
MYDFLKHSFIKIPTVISTSCLEALAQVLILAVTTTEDLTHGQNQKLLPYTVKKDDYFSISNIFMYFG